MDAEIEFCLLGPLVVRRNSMVVSVPQGKQRTVLAALLMNAGQVVSVDELTETLWAGNPPPSAKVTVQNYVMRLRRTLGTAGSLISTQPHGYLIRVDTSELDLRRFEAHLATAREAARDSSWQAVAAEARAALSLWRGEPLADIDSEPLQTREAPRLAEMRLQALETRIDADLHLGRHAEVITELQRLTADHPLRERLHGLLMLALYKDNRQAEALAAYRQARQVLVEELGTEPGAGLRRLQRQILSADPALADPEPAPSARHTAPPAMPRQLLPGVRQFTGRTRELATLTELLDTSEKQETPGMVVISAIGGTAGVGKTALALHWAHRVAHRFPDGHLYINLRGFDPSGTPATPAEVIRGFLDALGVAPERIPALPDALAGLFRSLVADKRMLIMLDNARDEQQVRPLLPASPRSLVVVTSRSQLAGLAATDGARLLSLDVLTHGEAVELLTTRIGPSAVAEPEAIAEIATRCACLPLALAVAAARAAERPGFPIATLAAELRDAARRLDALDTGDASASVRTVFSWSYQQLSTEAAQMYRLLGLRPGPDIEAYAAAALTGAALPQARRVLDVLARAHLLQPAAPGRYCMHDLLRAYARELSATLDAQEDQHAALTRLFDHYLHTAAAAMDTLFPAGRHLRPRIPRPDTPIPPLPDPAAALQWLDGERAALVAAAAHTAVHGWPGHTTRLAATLPSYLVNGGHFPEAVTVYGHALGAARRTADRAAEAKTLNLISNIDLVQGRLQQAADHYQQAIGLYRAVADRAGEARALGNLGIAEMELGRCEQAARHHHQAAAIFRDLSEHFGEARALTNLGLVRGRQGRYLEAADYQQQALDLSREIGDRHGEATALGYLGAVGLRLGHYQQADGYLQQAMAMLHEMGDTSGEAEILVRLGEVYLGLGRYEQAGGNFEQALAVFREIGHRVLEADALNGLGEVSSRTGDAGKARAYHAAALRLASEADAPLEQARAHSGLARACQADGDLPAARHHWQQALTRYTATGAPEASEIRARLAMPGDGRDEGDKAAEMKDSGRQDLSPRRMAQAEGAGGGVVGARANAALMK